jgi:hypothetical protein
MLSLSIVEEIDRLLREGQLSQRRIAAQLGVSRGTVGAIANGRRGIHGKEASDDERPLEPQGPPERCPRCGFTVYMPCLICQTRDYRTRQAMLQAADEKLSDRLPSSEAGRCDSAQQPACADQPASSAA